MGSVKSQARKNVGLRRVWHPATIRAAKQGGEEALAAARAALVSWRSLVWLEPDVRLTLHHSDTVALDGTWVEDVPYSPFPAQTAFGIVALAVWYGHQDSVSAFLEAGAPVNGTAVVRTVPFLRRWAERGLGVEAFRSLEAPKHHADGVRVTPLQIALYKRDASMVKLLLEAGANVGTSNQCFILDIIPPMPGSLFATKAGAQDMRFLGWDTPFLLPPKLTAAVQELRRITLEYGSTTVHRGQLVWPFNKDILENHLLPKVLRSNFKDWLDVPNQEQFTPQDNEEEEE